MEDETPREEIDVSRRTPFTPPATDQMHPSSNGTARRANKPARLRRTTSRKRGARKPAVSAETGAKKKSARKKDRHVSKRPIDAIKVLQAMFRSQGQPSFRSHRAVAESLGMSVPAVAAILHEAFLRGSFSVAVNIPHDAVYRCQLESELKGRYALADVVLVPGNDEMLTPSSTTDARDIHREVTAALARRAAPYLDEALKAADARAGADGFRLGVAWGQTMQKLAEELRSTERPFKIPRLDVVPIIGLTGVSYSGGVEANTVAVTIRDCYGGHASQMPCPAFVERMVHASVYKKNRQVMKMRKKIADCSVVVTGMGPILAPDPEKKGHTGTRLVNDDAMFNDELAGLAYHEGAVAEICYWLVNADGKEVLTDYEAIGLGFEGLRRTAANRDKRVILVTGGDRRRFEPLKAILKARLISVLITDATTGRMILGK